MRHSIFIDVDDKSTTDKLSEALRTVGASYEESEYGSRTTLELPKGEQLIVESRYVTIKNAEVVNKCGECGDPTREFCAVHEQDTKKFELGFYKGGALLYLATVLGDWPDIVTFIRANHGTKPPISDWAVKYDDQFWQPGGSNQSDEENWEPIPEDNGRDWDLRPY